MAEKLACNCSGE